MYHATDALKKEHLIRLNLKDSFLMGTRLILSSRLRLKLTVPLMYAEISANDTEYFMVLGGFAEFHASSLQYFQPGPHLQHSSPPY
jgi:hypothetical protein